MAIEEARCKRVKLERQNKELIELYLEEEDAEIEDDELAVVELESFESLHRAQVSSHLHPNLSQLNPNLKKINPNLTHFNPNLSQLNRNLRWEASSGSCKTTGIDSSD